MTSPSDCVAIIPAKGTSRRLPAKNILECAGKTLLRRAMEVAVDCGLFSEIVVSSESLVIQSHARLVTQQLQPPFVCTIEDRPPILSQEGVGVAAVVLDILARRRYIYDSLCVLWPTSPLRTPQHLHSIYGAWDRRRFKSIHTAIPGEGYQREPWRHEGTAIFMETQEFLKRLSLDYYRFITQTFAMMPSDTLDVNTPDDLAEAERRLLAREAKCLSS